MSEITREEWVRRYAARVHAKSELPIEQCTNFAEIGAESYEYNYREKGEPLVWHGEGHWLSPESLADEEMSYWEDDD